MNNIFVLDKNYNKIGTLSNQGVKPLAPYFNDLFVQELETGADTYEFSTLSNSYTQGCIEIGNHIMFAYKNRNELFTITSIEHSHNEGYKTVGVYAESVGFELLDIFMEKPKTSSNNSRSGGNDSDGDGDDNTDDEYADPDDVYIDENGNIIYDKNGGTDYADPEDVVVDGNGNIIYKPKNNKKYKDRPSDFLEFKNISYPTFIKMILKNTDWSYVCQPGLESNKQDMRVSYDTNIYAILQDSMQDYKGVELEFRYEYNNGRITKTVYAYNDGGRGSFIGKRFVYGQNVKGITKTQEVTHEKDDAIIFVDDIGVEITYDVDFALKSAEVPEIEIGDTHYVIDSDFHPPMQIKARIGKIEVSFSDPTRNKIYLANNKKIRGSVLEDELDDYEEYDDIAEPEEPEPEEPEPEEPEPEEPEPGEPSDCNCLSVIEYENVKYYAMSEPIHDGTTYVDSVRGIYISRYDPNWPSEPPLLLGAGQFGRDILNAYRFTANTIYCVGDQVSSGIIQCSRLVCSNPQMNSDKSLKENIRYIDAPTTYSNYNLLEKTDLYDFIVNQVNICEYNYIGNTIDKIGFIANDYEGTKVGDKIVYRDIKTNLLSYDISNLLFATIGALQEEVRTRDEKVATLEDRLARIEALLGINNNDN